MDALVEEALDRRLAPEIRARRIRAIARLSIEAAGEALTRLKDDPAEPQEIRLAASYGLGLIRARNVGNPAPRNPPEFSERIFKRREGADPGQKIQAANPAHDPLGKSRKHVNPGFPDPILEKLRKNPARPDFRT